MKVEIQPLQKVSPELLKAIAAQAGEAGQEALAGFVKTLIQERYCPPLETAGSTPAPFVPRSEQPLQNTQTNQSRKGN
jgi:hypothetical protein